MRSPPYPAAAPASTTAKPSTSRRVRQQPGECHSHGDGTSRIVRAGPPPASTVLRIPLRGTRLRRAVDPGASASPAGLTARARPEARPEGRAANLPRWIEQREKTPRHVQRDLQFYHHHGAVYGTVTDMQSNWPADANSDSPAPASTEDPSALRAAVLAHLEDQGFHLNDRGFLMEAPKDKDAIRKLHRRAVQERRDAARKYLLPREAQLLRALADPSKVKVENIKPSLRLIDDRRSGEADLWRWTCLHWSIPTSSGYGRRLRFLVTDSGHDDALIGVIGLGDPVFALAARDAWIRWHAVDRRKRLTCVMDAFVLGAAPPYDRLLGAKLVALLATSREVQDIFRERYGSRITLIEQRNPQAELTLVTTTSALGRSSVYNRLTGPSGNLAYIPVGWTLGSGDFHLSGDLYKRLARFARDIDPEGSTERHERWTGNGFRNRREVVTKALEGLGLPARRLRIHGIRRQIYVAPLVENATEYLRGESNVPDIATSTVAELADHWRQRWGSPRQERLPLLQFQTQSWALWS